MARYNQYNRNRMSLNTVDFQPTVFTPIEFRPVEQDYSILERAMAKQEERKEKAVTQQSLVKQALGKAREQLHQDDETLAWFDAKARKIEDDIKTASEVGDYATALQTGIEAAGDIVNDTELNARIRTNAQYKEEYERQRQRVGKGISQETFNWWAEKNPYKYSNIEQDGRVIGGEDWKSNFTPVDDLNWASIFAAAKELNMPEQGSSGGSSNLDEQGNVTNITKGGSTKYQRMRPEVIADAAQKLIGNNWSALVQDFDVKMHQLEKLEEQIGTLPEGSTERMLKEQQLNNLQLLLTGGNSVKLTNDVNGWITYFTRTVEKGLYSDNLSYNWVFSEGSSIGTNKTTTELDNLGSGGATTPSAQGFVEAINGGFNEMGTPLGQYAQQATGVADAAIGAYNTDNQNSNTIVNSSRKIGIYADNYDFGGSGSFQVGLNFNRKK